MKKISILLSVAVILTVLVSCGQQGDVTDVTNMIGNKDEIILRIGHVEPEDRSTHKALLEFKENIESRTDDKVKIEIYPNGVLGGDVQLIESVVMGTLDMALPATSVLTTYSEDFGLLDMPYLFKDSETSFTALDGDVGEYFNNNLLEQGIYNLGFPYNGSRSTTTNSGPIEKPEDFKGVKIRVMESPIFIDFYTTLGGNATPMSFTELYTGLQQGTVAAQENPPSLIYANKLYEVQKYLSVTEHVHNFLTFAMNKEKLESLDNDYKEIILEEAQNFVEIQRNLELEDTHNAIELLESEGGLITNILDEDQKKDFREQLQPMYDKYESKFGEDLFKMCDKYN